MSRVWIRSGSMLATGMGLVGTVALLCGGAALVGCGADKGVGAGNPRTLAPLVGGGGRPIRAMKPPAEPVDDLVIDVGMLREAWPRMSYELPRLLRSVIARGSWTDVHHAASCNGAVLRVRHRPAVVAEVKKLVALLRGQLLTPMHIQVRFVEVAKQLGQSVFPPRADGRRGFTLAGFVKAVAAKRARSLARAVFDGENGRWGKRERLANQAFLAGVHVAGGVIQPRTTTLASGSTLQAAAWRWGRERAVVALTGSYTGEAKGGITVKQTLHRRLPSAKTTERRWQSHELPLALPVRELVEVQSTLAVERGKWTTAALVPRPDGRLVGVLVKVDWTPRQGQGEAKLATDIKVSPLSPQSSFALTVIPVALPRMIQRQALAFANDDIRNRRVITEQSASWFRKRAKLNQALQKKNVYNFQSSAGQLALGTLYDARKVLDRVRTFPSSKTESWKFRKRRRARLRPPAGGFGAMPPALEKLKAEVMSARWPAGTALEFVANHVFVVHRRAVADKVAKLLSETHAWRNQRVVTRVDFPLLTGRATDGLANARLDAARAKALRAGKQLSGAAFVLGRASSRTEIFVGEMHAALSSAWAPNTSSPPVHVFWRGVRLAMLPRLGASGGRAIGLHVRHHRLAGLQPKQVAGALLQQPRDATWSHRQRLTVPDDKALLTGVSSTKEGLLGLLVSARWLK
jgi:hypothetical protein